MLKRKKITFDAFTLDTKEELLWKGTKKIHLRPKTFALLRHLTIRSGHLVTKNELLNAVWGECNVGEEALKHCMVEIRKALDDNAEKPRFIETVHRRGYRFIWKPAPPQRKEKEISKKHPEAKLKDPLPGSNPFVGREIELDQLQWRLEETLKGYRQTIFISGEQGIGKTSLVDSFLDAVSSRKHPGRAPALWISRGQCIQSHGPAEAYMPLMEALTALCNAPGGRRIINVLCRYAPLWMAQLPSQLSADQILRIRLSTRNATRERMLRELAEALEEITRIRPLILVLEDLHWSDPSTLDWISYWTRRRESSRLLVLATYRTTEVAAGDHLFKNIQRELRSTQLCEEIELPSLEESLIGEYLKQRFPSHEFPAQMTHWVQQRTGGNPLFLVNLLSHLSDQEFIVERNNHWILDPPLKEIDHTVPPTIRQIVDQQIECCTPQETSLLQAASVKGMEFSAAGVAAALNKDEDEIEIICRNLATRGQFLQTAPNRTVLKGSAVASYRFIHVLYRNICYQSIPSERRIRFHRRIAAFLERLEGRQQQETAEMAMHFQQGRQYRRAVGYYRKAVDNANARYAGHEAVELATKGIRLLELIPATSERLELEIRLQNALGTALMSVEGLGTEKAGTAFKRARELFQKLSLTKRSLRKSLIFQSLFGLWSFYWVRADYIEARRLAERLLKLAQSSRDPHLRAQSHYAVGIIQMDHGKYHEALDHLQRGSGVICRCCAEIARWHVGQPDRAINNIENVLAYALETRNAENVIFAHQGTARVNMARGEYRNALDHTQSAIDIARNQGMDELWLIPMRIINGWALSKLGKRNKGIRQMRQALSHSKNIEVSNLKPLLSAIYAEILLDSAQIEEGLAVVEEALDISNRTAMHHYDAELYRLKGEMLLRPDMNGDCFIDLKNANKAEDCFKLAEEIAIRQKAKSLELRAVMSLARLWLEQNRKAEAQRHLNNIYGRFTEGYGTADLKNAHELLRKLEI